MAKRFLFEGQIVTQVTHHSEGHRLRLKNYTKVKVGSKIKDVPTKLLEPLKEEVVGVGFNYSLV